MKAKSRASLGDGSVAAADEAQGAGALSSAELAVLAQGEAPYEFVKADVVDFDSLVCVALCQTLTSSLR